MFLGHELILILCNVHQYIMLPGLIAANVFVPPQADTSHAFMCHHVAVQSVLDEQAINWVQTSKVS